MLFERFEDSRPFPIREKSRDFGLFDLRQALPMIIPRLMNHRKTSEDEIFLPDKFIDGT